MCQTTDKWGTTVNRHERRAKISPSPLLLLLLFFPQSIGPHSSSPPPPPPPKEEPFWGRRKFPFSLMGYPKFSFRSKAAHLVSDITTVILNPISDEPSTPREVKDLQDTEVETESGVPDGPDTSSFTAFLVSLLSSSEAGAHSNEEFDDRKDEIEAVSSTSEVKGYSGKKGLISRGKQSINKVFNKAAKLSGFRYNKSEQKSSYDFTKESNSIEQELVPLDSKVETALKIDLPDISEPSMLLSENMRTSLYTSLPVQIKGRNWVLLYSTWRHGISLSTLYRRSMLCPGYSLLIIGDQKGAVFGGLIEVPLRPTTKKKYQGTNSTFVFTNLSNRPVIFRPTGANRYFTLCSTDFLALGGGAHFALYLDGDLLSGSSYASETFGNSCLAHTQDFEIKEVELWGFVYASQYEETLELCRTEVPGVCRL